MSEPTTKVEELKSKDFAKALPEIIRNLDAKRKGSNQALPLDISFSEMVEGKWAITKDDLLKKLDINPKISTLENIFSMPDTNYRWVVPEIIRDAINLGIRQTPFYPNIIAGEQSINGLKVTMPYVNMADATPAKVNEGETIPLGNISYGQKQVTIFKIGKGIKVTYEVRNYTTLDVFSLFLRDFGIQLGYTQDTLAIDTIINGNQTDGSESVPVIGVRNPAASFPPASGTGIQYRDLLRVWVRASRLGRNFTTLVGGEDAAIEMLDLPEFKDRSNGTTQANLNVRTPIPRSADFFIHPGVPQNDVLLIDKSASLIKLNAQPLTVESEKIVSSQIDAIYATLTTGFSKMFLDASILINPALDFASNGFPSYMDIDQYLMLNLEN